MSKEAQIDAVRTLTKEHFYRTAVVHDDPLDTVATITTARGFQEKHGIMGFVYDDNFLRAFIDKNTGEVTYQVYQVIHYQDRSWNFYNRVNFETLAGPQSRNVTVIGRDVDCAGSRYRGCTYVEDVGFEVDDSLLRAVASRYVPGDLNVWKFKFGAKSGEDHRDGILSSEVAGFLDRVDAYRNQ
jgi:hypothetical protein